LYSFVEAIKEDNKLMSAAIERVEQKLENEQRWYNKKHVEVYTKQRNTLLRVYTNQLNTSLRVRETVVRKQDINQKG
jgi:hypothetical protein